MRVQPFPLMDQVLVGLTVLLLGCGLVMVASSSIALADARFHQPFYFFYRQLVYMGLGIGIAGMVICIPLAYWMQYSRLLFLLGVLALVCVLWPGVGHSVNGAMRWLRLGPLGFQPSEYMKVVVVVYMAGFLVSHPAHRGNNLAGFAYPMAVLTGISLLLILEPDFGSVAVISSTVIGMLFLAGIRVRLFIGLGGLVAAILALLAFSSPYRLARMTAFLNPWADQYASGYQLTQSLIAFGRGSLWGVGLGEGLQKWFYLPEAHTDFVFAVLAEELGFVGVMGVMALMVCWVGRIAWWGYQATAHQKWFAAYLAYGLAWYFGIQVVISMGVNTGLLPTKGLALPFFSYGGSSIIMNMVAVGLVLRVTYECRTTQGTRRG